MSEYSAEFAVHVNVGDAEAEFQQLDAIVSDAFNRLQSRVNTGVKGDVLGGVFERSKVVVEDFSASVAASIAAAKRQLEDSGSVNFSLAKTIGTEVDEAKRQLSNLATEQAQYLRTPAGATGLQEYYKGLAKVIQDVAVAQRDVAIAAVGKDAGNFIGTNSKINSLTSPAGQRAIDSSVLSGLPESVSAAIKPLSELVTNLNRLASSAAADGTLIGQASKDLKAERDKLIAAANNPNDPLSNSVTKTNNRYSVTGADGTTYNVGSGKLTIGSTADQRYEQAQEARAAAAQSAADAILASTQQRDSADANYTAATNQAATTTRSAANAQDAVDRATQRLATSISLQNGTARKIYGTPFAYDSAANQGGGGFVNTTTGDVVKSFETMARLIPLVDTQLEHLATSVREAQAGFGDKFINGFFGAGGRKYTGGAAPISDLNPLGGFGETAGIVAKYSLQGRAIQSLATFMSDAVKGYAQLDQATRQYNEITDQANGASGTFIANLQNIAAEAGVDVPTALEVATKGVAAFTDASDSKGQKQAVGQSFAQAAIVNSTLTGQEPIQAGTDLLAIGKSFNVGADGIAAVNNAIANAHKNFGSDSKEISQGLQELADDGKAAGYSLSELANVVGLVAARTGESGGAVASNLQRVFAQFSSSAGKQALQSAGVDTDGTLKQQIEALASQWGTLSEAEQQSIESHLGGAKALKELLPLLTDNKELQDAFTKSLTNGDEASKQYQATIGSLAGQLKSVGADFKAIAVDLAESGFLTPLVLAFETLRPVLTLLKDMLQVIDSIPAPLRDVAMTALDVAAAFKLWGLATAAAEAGQSSGALGFLGRFTKPGRENAAAAAGVADNTDLRGSYEEFRAQILQAAAESSAAITKAGDGLAAALNETAAKVGEKGAESAGASTLGAEVAAVGAGEAVAAGGAAEATASADYAEKLQKIAEQVTYSGEALETLKGKTEEAAAAASEATAAKEAETASDAASADASATVAAAKTAEAAATEANVTALEESAVATEEATVVAKGALASFALALREAAAKVQATAVTTGSNVGGFLNKDVGLPGVAFGAIATAAVVDTAFRSDQAQNNVQNAAQDALGNSYSSVSSSDLKASAEALSAAADNMDKAGQGVVGHVATFFNDNYKSAHGEQTSDQTSAQLKQQAQFDADRAKERADLEKSANKSGILDFSTANGVSDGLKQMAEHGASATEQLHALIAGLDDLANAATTGARVLTAKDAVLGPNTVGTNIANDVSDYVSQQSTQKASNGLPLGILLPKVDQGKIASGVQDALKQGIDDMGIKPGQVITPNQSKQLADIAAEATLNAYGLTPKQLDDLNKYAPDTLKGITVRATGDVGQFLAGLSSGGKNAYTADNIDYGLANAASIGNGAASDAQNAASLNGSQSGAIAGAQARIDAIRNIRDQAVTIEGSDADLTGIDADMAAAQLQLQQATVSHLQALGALAQAEVSPFDKEGQINAQLKTVQSLLAVATDPDQIAQLSAQQSGLVNQHQQQILADQNANITDYVDPANRVDAARAAVTAAQNSYDFIKSHGGKGQALSDAWAALQQSKLAAAQTETEDANSARDANVGVGDKVALELAQAQDLYDTSQNQTGGQRAATQAQGSSLEVQGLIDSDLRPLITAGSKIDPRDVIKIDKNQVAQDQTTYNDLTNFEPGNKEGIAAARAKLAQDTLKQDQDTLAKTQAERKAGIDSRDTIAQAQEAVTETSEAMKAAKHGTAAYWDAKAANDKAKLDLATQERQKAEAARDANTFPGSEIQKASAALADAAQELAADKKNTIQYYQDLAKFHQSQADMAAAVQTAQHNNRLLNIDLTDPVAIAEEDARTAREKLAEDQKNKAPADVIAADKVDVRQKDAAAEKAGFEQQLQDAQTNYQLGRTTQAAYMQYLEGEHNRLSLIKNRTRQQQDELNEVDSALKGLTSSSQGQFNLGQIVLPTVYEVRRVMAATGAALSEGMNSLTQQFGTGEQSGPIGALNGVLNGIQTDTAVSNLNNLSTAIDDLSTAAAGSATGGGSAAQTKNDVAIADIMTKIAADQTKLGDEKKGSSAYESTLKDIANLTAQLTKLSAADQKATQLQQAQAAYQDAQAKLAQDAVGSKSYYTDLKAVQDTQSALLKLQQDQATQVGTTPPKSTTKNDNVSGSTISSGALSDLDNRPFIDLNGQLQMLNKNMAASSTSVQSTVQNHSTTNVEINGADFARVVQFLNDRLGPLATQASSTKPRKVY